MRPEKRRCFVNASSFTWDNRRAPMIVPGRVVEARVIAVAQKAVRLEVFGVECS